MDTLVLLAARDPSGRLYGRQVVLRTIVASLERLGWTVHVVALAKPPAGGPAGWSGPPIEYLPPPSMARVLWNVATRFLPGRLSLNECLFHSPAHVERFRAIVARTGASGVVGDMIRTAPYLAGCGVPWVLDLDDLLSVRYSRLAGSDADSSVLVGYYTDNIPRALRRVVTAVATRLLRWEARVLAAREERVARAAPGVSLVNGEEAEHLEERIGREVAWLPMSVDVPAVEPHDVSRRPLSMVFLGRMDYQANLDAIRHYVREVAPVLEAGGVPHVLTVIGYCPDDVRAELSHPSVRLLGYAEDLWAELARHQLFLAPIVSGTGIKTKVLEAMGIGLPVLSTGEGMRGLDVRDGVHFYHAETAAQFRDRIRAIDADPAGAAAVARAGRDYVRTHFSPAVLAARWERVLRSAGLASPRGH